MIVHKLNEQGEEVIRYAAEVLEDKGDAIRLAAHFNRDSVDIGYVVFRRGDRFIETFYSGRWYNVFAVHDGEGGELKGWYCNICRPARWEKGHLWCEDLALDLWVGTDGTTFVMDEDEFEQLELDGVEREQAQQALSTLLQMAAQGELPR